MRARTWTGGGGPPGNDYRGLAAALPPLPAGREPAVSVLVPYAGAAEHLRACLGALAEQRYPAERMQVVVVRCPSAEPAGRLLDEMSERMPLVRLRHERRGFAPAFARNRGLEACEGEVVVSLDDDVVAPPSLLRAHARWHRAGAPVATFGLRRFITLPASGAPRGPGVHAALATRPDLVASRSNRPGHGRDWRLAEARRVHRHPQPHDLFHGCNISYGRRRALRVGGWNEAFDGCYGYEDVEFGARLHADGAYIVWVPEAQVLHLEDPRPVEAMKRARERNFELACRLIPGFREARAARGPSPWRRAPAGVGDEVPATAAGEGLLEAREVVGPGAVHVEDA